MKPFKFCIYFFILIIICGCKESKQTLQETIVSSGPKIKLEQVVRLSKSPKSNPPLLILLHGRGSNENDLFNPLESYIDSSFVIVSLRAPITLRQDSYSWYPIKFTDKGLVIDKSDEAKAVTLVYETIKELIRTYKVDKEQVYLMGFSQGAILSSAIIMKHPELISGAVILSGGIPKSVKTPIDQPKLYSKAKIFMSHGKKDDVLSIDDARILNVTMKNWGIENLTYVEHDGGHTLDNEHLNLLLHWLSSNINNG